MGKTLTLALGVIFLGSILVIPSGISAYFDGLPWVNSAETLTLSVVVPFLVALGWRFLSLRISVLSLGALLLLKVILAVGSPASGWLIKVHPNLTQEQSAKIFSFQLVEGDSWVRTYATLWNEEASGILKKPWTEKLDFPLDWFLSSLSCKDIENKNITMATQANAKNCLDDLNPILEINGAVFLPKGNRFSIVAEGVQEGNLVAVNDKNESFVLSPAKNFVEAGLKQYQLPKGGIWQISGKLTYKGANWSLIPILISDTGETTSELGRDILWQNGPELIEKKNIIWFYKMLGHLIDFGIYFFLLVWASWTTHGLVKKEVLTWPLALFSLLALFTFSVVGQIVESILRHIGSSGSVQHSNLGISIIITSIGLLCWIIWKQDYRNFHPKRITKSIFLFYGIIILSYFSHVWRHTLGKWNLWSPGDDWTAYQGFARKIVVGEEWLNAGEGIFTMQPLYRYFVGIYHLLFGQSAFAQNMADVWCVLGATTIIVAFAIKFRFSPILIFTVSMVYLAINFISSLRYHIGRGLVENHAMIFMMLAAWFLYSIRERGGYRIILATLFGIFGYWTRQDHLGAIAGLAFLSLEPIQGATGDWKGYWDRFKLQWKVFAWYWGVGVLSVLLICFRNWWLGGAFYPTIKSHPNLDLDYYSPFPGSLYIVLTGKSWPAFPGMLGIIVTIGVIVALLALVWRLNVLKNFPLGLSIIIVGLLFPYAFLMTWGYAPRYSIHLLPLALLSVGYFLNYHVERLKWSFRFNYQGKNTFQR
jgi:hypothetical protein